MYWTHLIFALIISLLQCNESLTAIKPGYLDFDNLPETNFSCKNKVIGGYYADVETGCQMFHVCTIGQKGTETAQSEVTDIKFLCLNGTVFDQETRVCERIDEVDCSKSEDFFNLNLELYGNHAGGIQPEEEFFCEDCSTEEDDYDLSSEVTTRPSSTSTSSTTTTTHRTTTITTTTTAQPTTRATASPNKVHYTNSDSETIAALLALHNAFSHSVQNQPTQQTSKVKPPPPRVINNAFASIAPSTAKPSAYYPRPQVTQLPPRIENNYDEDDRQTPSPHHHRDQNRHYAHGTLQLPSNVKERHKTNFYQATTPTNLNSNYHHFQSGEGGFVHSFEPGKQYNYQYYQPRNLPEESKTKASVSIVTSTSTSTSVRASKPNVTVQEDLTGPEEEFPTAYDDYPDDAVDEAFFRDVPKLRTKRSEDSREPRYSNHKYPDESENSTTSRHSNHRYVETTINPFLPKEEVPSTREEFLQNLLGSLDMEEHERQKMAQLFKNEEQEMKKPSESLKELGNKLGELIMDDINKTIHIAKLEEKNSTGDVLDMEKIDEIWRNHYAEMSQEVDLKFDLGVDRDRRDADKKDELSKELARDYELASTIQSFNLSSESTKSDEEISSREKRQAKGLDTEKFATNHERRGRVRERPVARQYTMPPRTNSEAVKDIVPVVEDVDEGDFTTRPYLKTIARTQGPRLTTRSVENTPTRVRFNYEITTPETILTRRRKPSGRTATIRQPALVQPPILNLTRDVTKLKDTPVYEDNGDSKDFENDRIAHRQPLLVNQNAEERSYERLDTLSSSTVDTLISNIPTTEDYVQSTKRTSGRSRRPVIRSRQPIRNEGEHQSGPSRVVHRRRLIPISNVDPQILTTTELSHTFSTRRAESATESTKPQRELKGRDDYQTEEPAQSRNVGVPKSRQNYRGSARGTLWSTTPPNEPPPAPPLSPDLVPDPHFDCEGKVKGGFYSDLSNDCKGFFICSQGAINGPLLKSHFWCGTSTKFNQRSRTCQAEDLVECAVSERYFHLNQDFAVPETEEQLRPAFEPKRVQG